MINLAGRDLQHAWGKFIFTGVGLGLLIGVTLIAEGMHQHISKGYIYFAMAFSVFVEVLNIRLRKKAKPVILHNQFTDEDEAKAIS